LKKEKKITAAERVKKKVEKWRKSSKPHIQGLCCFFEEGKEKKTCTSAKGSLKKGGMRRPGRELVRLPATIKIPLVIKNEKGELMGGKKVSINGNSKRSLTLSEA